MASRSINRVIVLGNLTRDPELKYTPNGAPVCTFGVATNRSWTTAEGQTKEDTQYHRIVAWNKVAELCGKLLSKGKKVYVEGRLSYRSFTGKDGQQRNITEIVLDDFIVFNNGKRGEIPEEEKKEVATTPEVASVEEEASPPDESAETSGSKKKTKASNKEEEIVDPDDIPF